MTRPCHVCQKPTNGRFRNFPLCATHMTAVHKALGIDEADEPVLERTARSTKTRVLLYYKTMECDPAVPWTTVCEQHGGCICHATKALALQWLSHPEEWCPTCQEKAELAAKEALND